MRDSLDHKLPGFLWPFLLTNLSLLSRGEQQLKQMVGSIPKRWGLGTHWPMVHREELGLQISSSVHSVASCLLVSLQTLPDQRVCLFQAHCADKLIRKQTDKLTKLTLYSMPFSTSPFSPSLYDKCSQNWCSCMLNSVFFFLFLSIHSKHGFTAASPLASPLAKSSAEQGDWRTCRERRQLLGFSGSPVQEVSENKKNSNHPLLA